MHHIALRVGLVHVADAGLSPPAAPPMPRLPAEGSEPEPPLPLCSMSLWDPEQVRCSKVGHRERVHHSYIPGGAACVMHKNLAECPRMWE